MLKVSPSTKCAEIYCFESAEMAEFSIQCVCGLSTPDYDNFRVHFRQNHLEELHPHTSDPLESPELTPTQNACLEEPLLALPPTPTTIDDAATAATTPDVDVDVNWSEPYAPQLLNNQARRPYKPRNKPNTCSYCGRTFRRRYLLDTHMNIHTGRKPHQCDMCGKQFRAVSTLTRHLRTHEQRTALQCQHCEKLFTHRSALLSHEMRHTQQRRWPCDSCSKCFYTQNQMDTHRRKLHSGGGGGTEDDLDSAADRLPFGCELCSNSYRSASMLSTHKLKKHYRLAKYSCERCGQKFVDDERLQQHQLIHVEPATKN